MSDFRPKIVKTPVQIEKLALVADCPTASGKKSKLIWNISTAKNGMNPRIVVYTNDPNEANERHRGQISANLDMPVFYAMLEMLYRLADTPADTTFEPIVIQNMNYTFPGGKRSQEPSLVSEIRFGRSKDGICWISVLDTANPNRPKIKFDFMPSTFHKLVTRTGEELPKHVISGAMVKGYVKILENILTQVAVDSFDPNYDPRSEMANQNGQGNRGGGQSNQSSYQKPSKPLIDDDMEF